jgi:hypothetical protein
MGQDPWNSKGEPPNIPLKDAGIDPQPCKTLPNWGGQNWIDPVRKQWKNHDPADGEKLVDGTCGFPVSPKKCSAT